MNNYYLRIPGVWGGVCPYLPGVALSFVVAMAAAFVSDHYGGPAMLIALLMGMSLNFFSEDERCGKGIVFVSRAVLRIGVALLGLRITYSNVMGMGYKPIIAIMVTILATILIGVLVSRLLKLDTKFGVLSGSAVAICGASAALAVSAVLSGYKDRDNDTLLVVVGVTTLSTFAMVLYPIMTTLLNLNGFEASFFLGGTIHDVAQVVGAGYTLSEEIGDYSTLVKLLRVAMLVPVTIVLSFIFMRKESGSSGGACFPWFLLGFVALVCLNSFEMVAPVIKDNLIDLSRGCLLSAVAALGMKTSLKSLASVGVKPFLLLVIESLFIVAFILLAIILMR